MSGNMYEDTSRQMHWMSTYETDNASDAGSQYSDFGGYGRPRAPDLSQRMRKLYNEQLYTDVKFVVSCGIKPKPELRAHKAVLAIGSPEFARMLFGNTPSDTGRPTTSEYEIKNVPFQAFRNVVEYLYTDDVYFEDNALVVQTMAAAKKFQVKCLVDRCESYFESAEISEENASSIYQMAMDNKMEGLKARCAMFIQDNTRDVIRSDDFKNSTLSTVRSICKLPRLNLSSEEELFEAILEWANLQPGANTSKRDVLLPLLKTIHFLSIPAMKFTQLVKKCPDIFTAEEAMHVVMHLANPNPSTLAKLPTWFNKGSNRCFNKPLIERVTAIGTSCRGLHVTAGSADCSNQEYVTECKVFCHGRDQGVFRCTEDEGWTPTLPRCARPLRADEEVPAPRDNGCPNDAMCAKSCRNRGHTGGKCSGNNCNCWG